MVKTVNQSWAIIGSERAPNSSFRGPYSPKMLKYCDDIGNIHLVLPATPCFEEISVVFIMFIQHERIYAFLDNFLCCELFAITNNLYYKVRTMLT